MRKLLIALFMLSLPVGVLAAGSGLLATAGSDAGGPLERALDKLRAAMGVRAGDLLGSILGGGSRRR